MPDTLRAVAAFLFCASAPYLRPVIDGRVEEWKDAIPVTFETAGKTTTVSTCWNVMYSVISR